MTKSNTQHDLVSEFMGTPHEFYMIPIVGGEFTMLETKKEHQVDDYYLGETPVTQVLWEFVIEGENPSRFKGKNRPVEQVSWFDAMIFCNKLSERTRRKPYYFKDEANTQPFGKQGDVYIIPERQDDKTIVFRNKKADGFRLPLEKEWEYAARGGNKSNFYDYAGGNDLDDVGWHDKNSHSETKPVKLKLPNELGLHDMSGNVREWCWDFYSEEGSRRVARGGSWSYSSGHCRSSYRLNYWPAYRFSTFGFRLALLFPFSSEIV